MSQALDDSGESTWNGLIMKPLRTRLLEARSQLQVPWEILERDYLLSWILAGISQSKELQGMLVFKGGTALKKSYFGDYRFSEDLDFSGVPDAPRGEDMEDAIHKACAVAVMLLDEYAPVDIECERYLEKEPHPGGQEAFTIRCRLPWQRKPMTRVMVEISMDEPILKPVQTRQIIHEYGEPIDARIQVYALEEIIGEKLRAILQHMDRLQMKGWARSRARDFYDLWRILKTYRNELNLSDFDSFLKKKCDVRAVAFEQSADFFQDPMISYVKKTWDQWLGPLVPDLPTFDLVIGELRPQIESIVD